jgi:hypothetical protein
MVTAYGCADTRRSNRILKAMKATKSLQFIVEGYWREPCGNANPCEENMQRFDDPMYY